jgi:hypothetical protein
MILCMEARYKLKYGAISELWKKLIVGGHCKVMENKIILFSTTFPRYQK